MVRTRSSGNSSAVQISPIGRTIEKAKAAQAKAKMMKRQVIIDINNKNYPSLKILIQTKPKEEDLIQATSTEVLNVSRGSPTKCTSDKDHLNTESTCTVNPNPIKTDCSSSEESDDIIFVNDYYEDRDVIFVNELLELKDTQDNKSVIVIEDDTIEINTPKTAKVNPTRRSTPVNSGLPPEPVTFDYIPLSDAINRDNNQFLFRQVDELMMCQDQLVQQEDVSNLNRFGSNFLNAGVIRTTGLRPIFIDGNNVAISHSNTTPGYFSVKGLKICIDYFKLRGHEVTAIVPLYRKMHLQNSDPILLQRIENERNVVFTPSSCINGRHIVPDTDRYIVLIAHVHEGIIVSSDDFQDILQENPNFLETIENRVVSQTWIKDMIMFPTDPLGIDGPKLDEFLRFP